MSVKSALKSAAAIMRVGGLIRGRRYDYERSIKDKCGPHCALGAIDCHFANEHEYTPWEKNNQVVEILANHLRPKIPACGIEDTYNGGKVKSTSDASSIVAAWNNILAKDADEVADAFEAAAATVCETE